MSQTQEFGQEATAFESSREQPEAQQPLFRQTLNLAQEKLEVASNWLKENGVVSQVVASKEGRAFLELSQLSDEVAHSLEVNYGRNSQEDTKFQRTLALSEEKREITVEWLRQLGAEFEVSQQSNGSTQLEFSLLPEQTSSELEAKYGLSRYEGFGQLSMEEFWLSNAGEIIPEADGLTPAGVMLAKDLFGWEPAQSKEEAAQRRAEAEERIAANLTLEKKAQALEIGTARQRLEEMQAQSQPQSQMEIGTARQRLEMLKQQVETDNQDRLPARDLAIDR